ncbi:FAD-dependent pyridine nucleotide-disulfide oxidoreductase [Desulfovibrio sp. X2]|uniref:CoB--CoM heterodisulfide reductase iron-sulfur subunit A family protein n=1 Tax=Desulfovibrio sp. X2 TaxID=941449 RepID=UPI000358C152|nr:CoB--CoM heterodisulfide reductase iron-sulfur subunit A family protein [Desulfovibrio sp. X2]EPR44426.1 FAD-dependent pyridine nucleotide-disulfide oxidoreductase [Desulfovibrio sp. X2]
MANTSILVVGGGFSGLTAALEAAEVGHEVFIVEKNPFLGGRVAQLNKYFPKLCPPSCGLEIQFQRVKNNPLVKVLTMAEVTGVSGGPGNYEVSVSIKPRHVGPGAADLSGDAAALSASVPSEFELGMGTRKALYMDMPFAFPHRYVLDKANLTENEAKALAANEAIDLAEQEKSITLNVGAIIYATGWKPYDMTNLTNLGAGMVPNVVSNMQLERLAAPSGPTKGRIVRPTDGAAPKRVAFVQCAGSRDENHLNYCSYICCMASLKQAAYIREQMPETDVVIYYIDLRTPGRYENFKQRILADEKIKTVKGKVAKIEASGGNVKVTVEDAVTGLKGEDVFDMVVLATGMQPTLAGAPLPKGVEVDQDGFLVNGEEKGIFAAGCAKLPLDVMKSAQSATGAALKAIQTVRGR